MNMLRQAIQVVGACLAMGAVAGPIILQEPADAVAYLGGSARFQVGVELSGPRTFQWWHEDTALAGETNFFLSRSLVVAADAGRYRVVVSDGADSISSRVATLQLKPAVALDRALIPGDRFGRFPFTLRFTEPAPSNTVVTVEFGPTAAPIESRRRHTIAVPAGAMEFPATIVDFEVLAALKNGNSAQLAISWGNAGLVASPRLAQLTYAKPPPNPTTGFSVATVSKAVASGLEAVVEIRRRGALPAGDWVRYATRDGTARSGKDYLSASETYVFKEGESATAVIIPTLVSQEFKGDRFFDVVLTEASPGAVIDSDSTRVMLAGDVVWPPTPNEPMQEGQRSGLVHFDLQAGPVRVQTVDVTATAGKDYVPIDQILPAGSGHELEITLIDDGLVEGPETFELVFSNPEDPTQVVRAPVRIEDNEIPLGIDESFKPSVDLNGRSAAGVMGAVAPDGTIFVASLDDATLFHLNAEGLLLDKVDLHLPSDFRSGRLLSKSDGQLLLGGAYVEKGSEWNAPILVRLRPDGTVDPTFQFGLPGTRVRAMAEHSSGTVLVIVTDATGDEDQLCRIRADGSLDVSFPNRFARRSNEGFADQRNFGNVVSAPSGRFWVEISERDPRSLGDGVMLHRVESFDAEGNLLAIDWSPAGGLAPSWVLADGRRYYAVRDLAERGLGGIKLERWLPDGSFDKTFLTSAYEPPQFKLFGVQIDGRPILIGLDMGRENCTEVLRLLAKPPADRTRLRWRFESNFDRGLPVNRGATEEGSQFVRPLVRLGDTSKELRVAVKTQPGTALEGIDYQGSDEVIKFPPFAVETDVAVGTFADDALEGFETFSLSFDPEYATAQTGGNRLTVGISDRTEGVKLFFLNPPFTDTKTVQVWYQVNVPLPVSVVVEESTDLTNWKPVRHEKGVTHIDDFALVLDPNEPRRFVRVRVE